MTNPVGKRGPNSSEAGTVASNGEIVPDESASAESIRRQADEHPASDCDALSDHVQSRQGDEPTGLTRDSATLAPAVKPVITPADDQPEYEGPNSL